MHSKICYCPNLIIDSTHHAKFLIPLFYSRPINICTNYLTLHKGPIPHFSHPLLPLPQTCLSDDISALLGVLLNECLFLKCETFPSCLLNNAGSSAFFLLRTQQNGTQRCFSTLDQRNKNMTITLHKIQSRITKQIQKTYVPKRDTPLPCNTLHCSRYVANGKSRPGRIFSFLLPPFKFM